MDSSLELPVIYRDDRLLAVNKPAKIAVHRGYARDRVTVADIVRDTIVGAPVHPVHRLDRATSGVLLFALDVEATRFFQCQFDNHEVVKTYYALVRGPMLDACILNHPVPRSPDGPRVDATTEFRPLSHVDRWSWIGAVPRTGRWHQIRRHLKHLSHPIVGDVKYGKGEINRMFRKEYGLHRMALHAARLQIRHPDGTELQLEAPLPDDLREPVQLMGVTDIE